MPQSAQRKDDPMTVARDLMTPDPQCVKEDQTLVEAARLLRDLDVGAMPICG
jgi:CBS domain-containing protein